MEVVKTACCMCGIGCGIDAHVEKGKIVAITPMEEHPVNNLCLRADVIPRFVHAPDRLTTPLIRSTSSGNLEEASWDDALDYVAERLLKVRDEFAPESFFAYLGVSFLYSPVQYLMRRLCDLYGTPNYTSGASLCYLAKTMAHKLTCGANVLPHHSAADTQCWVIWGNNPLESHPPRADAIYASTWRGAKLIVVDPLLTPLAKQADLHAQIRPGTDCALALGMLNVIINEQLYDLDFVKNWTIGFDQLAEHVKDFTPEKVEAITWVKAEDVARMARIYATSKPASITLGISLDHITNGVQALRAVTALMAITGNLDIPGGNVDTPVFRLTNLRMADKLPKDFTAEYKYPLFTMFTQEQTVVPLIDQLATGKPYPLKALLIAGANPALTWPNTNKFRKGRENLDLMVVVDIFMTDTAKMADVVLPGTTRLERLELLSYTGVGMSRSMVFLANPAIPPIYNSMSETRIWTELAGRLGYGEHFPWQYEEQLFEHLLEDTGISLDQLKQNPSGIYYARREFKKYLNEGFDTPSKKVELYSRTMEEAGAEPLPTFREPAESTVSRPDLAEEYPFILLPGIRALPFYHSQYRNIPGLIDRIPEPLATVNPKTAAALGIIENDLVRVETPRGSIELKAKLSEIVVPEVIAIQHGWSKANANYLTDDELRDPDSAYPAFKGILCSLRKAS